MRIILDSGKEVSIKHLSLTDWRRFMSEFMMKNPNANQAWDLMSCVRGPDTPSERPDMSREEHEQAYAARRKRKFNTVEIIREAMFFGSIGGCARFHRDTKVTLPPESQHDHFDRHVRRAANILGLEIQYQVDPRPAAEFVGD
ncbi:MAG: hypothetical protein AB7J46_06675 [Candidatus Altimarinota bacterium]